MDQSASRYFSRTYTECRRRFIAGATDVGASLATFPHKQQGLDDSSLSVDFAILGSPTAQNVLVLLSGVHGVEGFSGSAAQLCFLDTYQQDKKRFEETTRVVLIHGLNPFGFDFERRVNEDNVDLNRNFIDFKVKPSNEPYDRLAELLVPGSLDASEVDAATKALYTMIQQEGPRSLRDAVQPGQYDHPLGMFYGGSSSVWSRQVLETIVEDHCAGAQRVVVVDYHTGLGDTGVATLILNSGDGSKVHDRVTQWFPSFTIDPGGVHGAVSAAISGSVDQAFQTRLDSEVELTYIAFEVGTVPLLSVFAALREDHILHALTLEHGEESVPFRRREASRRALRNASDPDSEQWRSALLTQSNQVVDGLLRALYWQV